MLRPEKYTIKKLKNILSPEKIDEQLLSALEEDSRSGVRKLATHYRKLAAERDKKKREWRRKNFRRKLLFSQGYSLIAGLDEAGRGPLAGPVVAAAVILPQDKPILGLKDSKKLSANKREKLFQELKDKALGTATGMASPEEIDELNIHNATFLAMRRALKSLNYKPGFLLVDGRHEIPNIEKEQKAVINGDSRVNSIAAASIIAKVSRDRLIKTYHSTYPHYNFKKNKGYGTAEHISALEKYGPSPIHRRSFSGVKKNI